MRKRIKKKYNLRQLSRRTNRLVEILRSEKISIRELSNIAKVSRSTLIKLQYSRKVPTNIQNKIVDAVNSISTEEYELDEIFLHVEPKEPWPKK